MKRPDEFACALSKVGYTHTCMQLWPGKLDKYCDNCIRYAKEIVLEKYRRTGTI